MQIAVEIFFQKARNNELMNRTDSTVSKQGKKENKIPWKAEDVGWKWKYFGFINLFSKVLLGGKE